MKTKSGPIQPLIAELDNVIAAAKSAHLHETAALLRIARLDLMMRANGISTGDLELMSFATTHGDKPAKPSRKKKPVPN